MAVNSIFSTVARPTSLGGTVGPQSTATLPTNVLGPQTQAVSTASIGPQSATGSVPVTTPGMGSPVTTLAIILVLFGVCKYLTEHEKSPLDVHLMKFGVFNWVVGGSMALTFFVVMKGLVGAYKEHLPEPLTNFVLAA